MRVCRASPAAAEVAMGAAEAAMASAAVAAVVSTSGTSAEAGTLPAMPILRSAPASKKAHAEALRWASAELAVRPRQPEQWRRHYVSAATGMVPKTAYRQRLKVCCPCNYCATYLTQLQFGALLDGHVSTWLQHWADGTSSHQKEMNAGAMFLFAEPSPSAETFWAK